MPFGNLFAGSAISGTGMSAERYRMEVIANNIANAQTTRTPEGGAFRRQLVVLRGEQLAPIIDPDRFGVRVKGVVDDMSALRQVFDPSHPDANADGIVEYPNINLAVEMVDLLAAQRAYEANIDVILSGRRMNEKALEIIQA